MLENARASFKRKMSFFVGPIRMHNNYETLLDRNIYIRHFYMQNLNSIRSS